MDTEGRRRRGGTPYFPLLRTLPSSSVYFPPPPPYRGGGEGMEEEKEEGRVRSRREDLPPPAYHCAQSTGSMRFCNSVKKDSMRNRIKEIFNVNGKGVALPSTRLLQKFNLFLRILNPKIILQFQTRQVGTEKGRYLDLPRVSFRNNCSKR